MGRYGTREAEVDDLLRRGVLVDLLRAVRQGLRASVESYSIKKIEPFYGFERSIDLRDAGSSIVAFEQWLELGEGERPAADHLERIERYNEDDVVSNHRLRDWLEGRREELATLTGHDVPRPEPRDRTISEAGTEAQIREQALAALLAPPDEIPADVAERTPEQHARWLLAQLLGWHRREEKAGWWEFFRLMDLTADELVDEDGADRTARAHRRVWTSRREAAVRGATAIRTRRSTSTRRCLRPRSQERRPRRQPERLQGRRDRQRRRGQPDGRHQAARPGMGHPRAVVPLDIYRTGDHRARLLELGEWVVEHGIDGPGP